MEDYICDRDWIGIKRIDDMEVIPYGYPYAIVTQDLQLLKYIKKCDRQDCLRLCSRNPHYEDFILKKSKVSGLYIVKAVLPFSKVKTFI